PFKSDLRTRPILLLNLLGSNLEFVERVNVAVVTKAETMTIGEIYTYIQQESAKFGNQLLWCNVYRSCSKEILVVHVDLGLSPSQIARAIHESIREMEGTLLTGSFQCGAEMWWTAMTDEGEGITSSQLYFT
ncbi:unnamed protein product, partial [Brassica rapa]